MRPSAAKPGPHRPSPVDEELGCCRRGQRAHWHQDFAGDGEGLSARRHQAETGHSSDQCLRQGSRLGYHVLTVVQDDQERPPGQVADDELHGRAGRRGAGKAGYGRPESAGHRRCNALGFGHAGQVDEPGPVPVLVAQGGGHFER